jgi:hypothetical protein
VLSKPDPEARRQVLIAVVMGHIQGVLEVKLFACNSMCMLQHKGILPDIHPNQNAQLLITSLENIAH